MLHTMFQGHQPLGSREEDFLRFLPYMGMAAILVMWPGLFEQAFIPQWPTWEYSYKSLIQLPFSCHGYKSKWEICTKFLCLVEGYSTSFLKTFCQNLCNERAIKASLHYKSMEKWQLFGCHSNQSTYEMPINTTKFVEVHAMNISSKFQPYPPYSFWRVDFL